MIAVRRWGTAGVLALTVLIAGCSAGSQTSGPETSAPSTQTSTPGPSGSPAADSSASSEPSPTMASGDLEEQQFAAVRSYLEVRENSESVRFDGASSWRAAIRNTTTADGADQVIKRFKPPRTSPARQAATQNDYVVEPMVGECTTNPAMPATDTRVGVVCELIDLVTQQGGRVVPPDKVDPRWAEVGNRTSPLLVLEKSSGSWLVDADYTGQAS